MPRKSRLNPGGFAYGELTKGQAEGVRPGNRRDAPLSPRGRLIWRITWVVIGAGVLALVAAIILSLD